MSKPLQIIIKRKIDGPSVPELGTPTSVTFDSVTVPLVRPSTGPNPIASYSIERATSSAGPWTAIATGALIFGNPPTAYTDGGRTALTTYYYRARATDTGGRVSGYSATVSVTTASVITPPPPVSGWSPNYPRLARINLESGVWNFTNNDTKLANFAILGFTRYNGSDNGLRTFGQAVSAIKALAPATLGVVPRHVAYINNMEVGNGDPASQRLWNKCAAENWWLRAPWPSGPVSLSTYPENNPYNSINRTRAGQFADASGKTWIQWYAELMLRQNVTGEGLNAPCPALDGFFTDNVFWKERVSGDYNRDGSTESDGDAGFALSVRQGGKDHVDCIRSIWPATTTQIANAADWIGTANAGSYDNENYTPDYSEISPLAGAYDGVLAETYIGDAGSSYEWLFRDPSNGLKGWRYLRNTTRFFEGSSRNPALNVYFCDSLSTNLTDANYQKLRFAAGAVTVLADGCIDDRNSENWPTLPAIYTDNVGVGWLGQALQTPRYSAYQNGVYVREFQNGYVAVNPRNNGAKTFTLPRAVRNVVTGTVYNGGATIPIADRDGAFLAKA